MRTKTNKERQAAFRERKKKQGLVRRGYFLSAAEKIRVDAYVHKLQKNRVVG